MFFFLSPLPVLLAGWLLTGGCMPLPILDAHGVVRGTALDPSNRMHVLIENNEGIQYGVVNGLWLNPAPVTASGTLGETYGYPGGAGRGGLAMDPAGRPHVLFYSNGSTGWPSYLYGDLVHSWKESAVWESEVIGAVGDCALPPSAQPAIAVDGAGDVHVAFANMDCDSGDVEIRYAKKQEGLWSEEVVETVAGLYLGLYPVLLSRIALGPGGEPVIATGLGGWNLEPHCSDAVIRVAQPAEGGGWETEEIFTHVDPCEYRPLSGELHDLSLALGPAGGKAVGLVFQTSQWTSVSTSYSVLVYSGIDWVADPQPLCSGWNEVGFPLDCQAGDIAFDPAGRLHAMFTRERFEGSPGYSPVEQSLSMARRTETGWVEETIWDNSLYGVAAEYEYPPNLLFTSASLAKILYNNGQTLMLMTR